MEFRLKFSRRAVKKKKKKTEPQTQYNRKNVFSTVFLLLTLTSENTILVLLSYHRKILK